MTFYLRREGDDETAAVCVEMPFERFKDVLTDAAAMIYAGCDIGPRTRMNRDEMSKVLGEYMLNLATEIYDE